MQFHVQQPADAIAALAGCLFLVAAMVLHLRRWESRAFLFMLGIACLAVSAFLTH